MCNKKLYILQGKFNIMKCNKSTLCLFLYLKKICAAHAELVRAGEK